MTTSSEELSSEIQNTESTMSYQMMSPQPAARAAGMPDSEIGPGLYPNEVGVTLTDINQAVAIYVDSCVPDNNAGLTFYASARAISADGTTQLNGTTQLVTAFQHSSSQAEIATYGAGPIGLCMMLAALGEPVTQVQVQSGGETLTQGMIPWDANFLLSVSIRTMLELATTSNTSINAATLLPSPSPTPSPTPSPA
jgi:hypothetical protein